MAIWQDLVDDHGFPAAYASVRRFVATSGSSPPSRPGRSSPRPQVKKVKPITGTDRMVRDPASGKYRRTRLFTGSPAEAGMKRLAQRARRCAQPCERRTTGDEGSQRRRKPWPRPSTPSS